MAAPTGSARQRRNSGSSLSATVSCSRLEASHERVGTFGLVDIHSQSGGTIRAEALRKQARICVEQVLRFETDGLNQECQALPLVHSCTPVARAAL